MCAYGAGVTTRREDWFKKNEYRTIPVAGGKCKLLYGNKDNIRFVHGSGELDLTLEELESFLNKIKNIKEERQ